MILVYILVALYVMQQFFALGLFTAFLRRRDLFEATEGRRPFTTEGPRPFTAEGISVLMPVKGPESHLAEVIRSVLAQDYEGPVELVLAFQDAHDVDLPLARRFEAEWAIHANRSVRVLAGLPALGLNLKNSNLEHARRAARFDWIYCGDADTQLDGTHLRRALTLAQNQAAHGQAVVVTAISVHENAQQAGSVLESVGTNMEFANYFLLSHLSPKAGALNGASMLFHRDSLKKVGGLTPFLNRITDDLALQRAFVAAGVLPRLLPVLSRVSLERQTLPGFYRRQLRWQLIVRCFDPVVFYALAPTNWAGQWLMLFGGLLLEPKLFAIGLGVLGVRVLRSLLFQIGLGTPFADWAKSLALPVYDLVSPFIWLHTIFVGEVEWAGEILTVGRDGTLHSAPNHSAPDFSSAKEAR